MTLERIRLNRFLVIGRAGMDLYADPPGEKVEEARHFFAALGGSSANIAAGLTRMGSAAALVTSVSDDAVGRFTVRELKRYGIETDHVRTVGGEARNSLAIVETRLENCQSVIYRNGAADFEISREQIEAIELSSFGALVVTGTCLAMEPSRGATLALLRLARSDGLPIILDIDYRPYSWSSRAEAAGICLDAAGLSDVVVGNDEEFALLAGGDGGLALARELAQRSATVVIYKMGERGAVTFSSAERFSTGVYQVTALKPTGAGDAFLGTVSAGLAGGRAIQDCIRRGSAAAAIVVTRVGCAPAMPTPAELEQFMADHALRA